MASDGFAEDQDGHGHDHATGTATLRRVGLGIGPLGVIRRCVLLDVDHGRLLVGTHLHIHGGARHETTGPSTSGPVAHGDPRAKSEHCTTKRAKGPRTDPEPPAPPDPTPNPVGTGSRPRAGLPGVGVDIYYDDDTPVALQELKESD